MKYAHTASTIGRVAVALVAVLWSSGCSRSSSPEDATQSSLRTVYQAYMTAEQQLGHPPRNAGEITAYVPEEAGTWEDCSISPHDQEHYVVLWGASTTTLNRAQRRRELLAVSRAAASLDPDAPPFPLLAYEQSGQDGKRFCLYVTGDIHPLGEEAFASALKAQRRPASQPRKE